MARSVATDGSPTAVSADVTRAVEAPQTQRPMPVPRPRRGGVLSRQLADLSRVSAAKALEVLETSVDGLAAQEAQRRFAIYGPNLVARERLQSVPREIMGRAINPLNGLLLALALVSYLLSDQRAAILIALMVVLSVSFGFIQEHRSNRAAAKLRAMVKTTAYVESLPSTTRVIPLHREAATGGAE